MKYYKYTAKADNNTYYYKMDDENVYVYQHNGWAWLSRKQSVCYEILQDVDESELMLGLL